MSAIRILAIVLIVAGILGLAYGNFSYTRETHDTKVGPLELSVKEKQTVNVPAWAGAAAIAAGAILLLEAKMKGVFLAVLVAAFLLGACAVRTGYRGEAVVVPALPSIVVLEAEPYYYHSGYYYFYQDNRWSYSKSRSGPWVELPRDRYPKEVKFKGRGDERGKDEKRGHDER